MREALEDETGPLVGVLVADSAISGGARMEGLSRNDGCAFRLENPWVWKPVLTSPGLLPFHHGMVAALGHISWD